MNKSNIINEIIETAKAQNMSQGELAARAGIRQETLSRARKNSTLRFKTVQQLAQIVGLKLKLIADNPIADKVQEGTLFPSAPIRPLPPTNTRVLSNKKSDKRTS